MAEITPLRFKKDTSWEGENELPEYYTDAEKRAGLLKFLGSPDGKGGYDFDNAKWEEQQEEYKKLSTKYGDARKDYDDWVKEQEEKGLELKDYENNSEFQKLDNAQKAAQAKLDENFSGDMQALLVTDAPEVALNFLQVYGEVEKDFAAHPELKEKFTALKEFTDRMIENGWSPEGEKNKLQLQYKDGQLLLRVDNLGGSGLKFAIKDDLSIVFTEDKTLKRGQVEELARVFDKVGMEVDNFSSTDKLKVVDDKDESKEVGSFENVFKSYSRAAWKNMELEELRRIQKENEDNGISNPALDDVIEEKETDRLFPESEEGYTKGKNGEVATMTGMDLEPSNEGNPFAEYLQEKDKNVSLRKMKEKILARGGIMRVDPRCIATRRMPDGSMVISFYNSEQDKMNDGKLDKDGIAKHTKKCAFRLWNTRPPRIGIYVPQGAKFETAYAKGALSALKGCGYNYFFMPSAAEFGGDAQKAFWEAAGDQLVCPLLKSKDNPNGCDIGNDHLQVILKAIKDKGADDEQDVLLFKMRLIGQLQAYKEYKESKGEKLSDKIGDTISMLEGDVRMHYFKNSVLPTLKQYISDGTNKGWSDIDITCAYAAVAKVTKAVREGYITYTDENGKVVRQKYDYLNPEKNKAAISKMFAEEMGKARPEVINAIKREYKNSGASFEDNDNGGSEEDEVPTSVVYKNTFEKAVTSVKNTYYNDTLKDETFKKIETDFAGSEVSKLEISNKGTHKAEFGGDDHPFSKVNTAVPDLSHISGSASRDYARGRARASSPTQARGGNGR